MNPQTNPSQVAGVVATSVIVLIKAIVAFLTALGVLNWDTAVETAFNAVVVGVLDVSVIAASFFWSSKQVTPLADPKAKDGEPLVRRSGSMRSAASDKV